MDTTATIALNEDNNWEAAFKNLRKYDAMAGEEIIYTVKEVDVPENYEVSITEENGKIIVTNTARFGSLIVEKVDEEGQPLPGATFELRHPEGDVVGTLTTDEDGTVKFEGLEWGDYTLIETKAPEGYNKLIKQIAITINGDNLHATERVINTQLHGNFQVLGNWSAWILRGRFDSNGYRVMGHS
ncbi:SpaA isopeptide-forming pilin-related protein [Bacillus sp. N9]